MMRRAALAFLVALASACGTARSADVSAPQPSPPANSAVQSSDDHRLDLQKPEDVEPPAEESWWQKVLRAAPNCKSFTDGCRTCSQTVCSNIGIACQPKDWSCNDDNPNAKSEAAPDEKSKSKQ
jgi:hypothetical protein